jgi:hypothetical protein
VTTARRTGWNQRRFNNNEELMEGAEMWLSSQVADFFETGIKDLFPNMTSASILGVTTLMSSLSMYIFFLYIVTGRRVA